MSQSPENHFDKPQPDLRESGSLFEQSLKQEIDRRAPVLPEIERQTREILDSSGQVLALVEPQRRREQNQLGSQDVWLVIDFDDVLFRTTSFMSDYQERLHQVTGLELNTIRRFYEESKQSDHGQPAFRHETFLEKIQAASKISPDALTAVFQSLTPKDYTEPAMTKAVLAARSIPDRAVRVSILSFGDPAYQSPRIRSTEIAQYADEIIITEGSKRAVMEKLLKEDYDVDVTPFDQALEDEGIAIVDTTTPMPEKMPMTLFVDDSPEQGREFDNILFDKGLVNIRFRDSQAKRSTKRHGLRPRIVIGDKESEHAGLELFRIAELAASARDQITKHGTASVWEMLSTSERRIKSLQQHPVRAEASWAIEREKYIQGIQNEAL